MFRRGANGLWLPDRFYAAGDLNSGGGRAGTAETDNYALDKPYDTGNSELDEMLQMLFRGLTRTRTTTTSLSSLITSLQSSISSLSLTVSGLSTGGLPGILNQLYYSFIITAGTVNSGLVQLGATSVAPVLTTSTGGILNTWTHDCLSTKMPMMLSESNPALTAAQSIYFGTPNNNASMAIQAIDNPILDVWFGTGTPTGLPTTGYKVWVGLFNQITAPTFSSDTAPATDFVAVRYSTAAADANFVGVTRDNSATNVATLTGAATYALETPYHVRIRTNDKGVTWLISVTSATGTTISETSVTTNVPRTTQNLFPFVAFHKEATGLTQQGKIYNQRIIVRIGTPVSVT